MSYFSKELLKPKHVVWCDFDKPRIVNVKRNYWVRYTLTILFVLVGVFYHMVNASSPEVLFSLAFDNAVEQRKRKSNTVELLTKWVVQNKKANIILSEDNARVIVELAIEESMKRNFDPLLFLSLMKVESEFDTRAVSTVGACGLTQIMVKYHKEKISRADCLDPRANIAAGAMVYREYLDWYSNNQNKALLQYNGSLHHSQPTYHTKVTAVYAKLSTYFDRNIWTA